MLRKWEGIWHCVIDPRLTGSQLEFKHWQAINKWSTITGHFPLLLFSYSSAFSHQYLHLFGLSTQLGS